MANINKIQEKESVLQEIRIYLFTKCQSGIDANGLVNSDFGKKLSLDWQKAKRYLEEIEKENLVHVTNFGNTKVYYPNGKRIGEFHPHEIDISQNTKLYMDNFPGPFGKPFIRLAQKRNGQLIGSVIIPEDNIDEFIKKIDGLSKSLKQLKKS
jgi:hypothetical protein